MHANQGTLLKFNEPLNLEQIGYYLYSFHQTQQSSEGNRRKGHVPRDVRMLQTSLLPRIPHHHLIDMLRHEVLNLGPGCGFEEVGVGHDDFVQDVAVVVGVAFQRPLGGGFASVGSDSDGGVLALEIGDVGLDDFLVVTTSADADDDAVHSEGHAFVFVYGLFVQCRGGFGEHVAQGQQGVGLAALGTTVKAYDSHGRFGIWNMVSRGARRRAERRCVIMANLLRCYRHSGLVMYFSTLPAPSASAPCILAILTHLRVRVKICILTHPQ